MDLQLEPPLQDWPFCRDSWMFISPVGMMHWIWCTQESVYISACSSVSAKKAGLRAKVAGLATPVPTDVTVLDGRLASTPEGTYNYTRSHDNHMTSLQ